MLVTAAIDGLKAIKSNIEKDTQIKGAFLDSRLVRAGSLFFAAKGGKSDGNDYVQNALDRGAAAVIMDSAEKYESVKGNKILVEDTLESLKSFGQLRYKLCKKRKIAVTGSFGKTGMKEMLKCVFGKNERVYATDGNKNNELGVALTGCGIDDEADTVIIELGSNNMGEISALSKTVMPDIAVVTTVGHAHIGRFGTIERIIFEKLSVTDGLSEKGRLVIPQKLKPFVPKGDYAFYTFGEAESASVYMTEFTHKSDHILFKTNIDDTEYRINHPYIHVAKNSLGAIMAALTAGMKSRDIAAGLAEYKVLKGHGSVEKAGDILLIDDTYNAGFESFIEAAASFDKINSDGKFAVFGEMGEIEGYERNFYSEIASLSHEYPDINFYLCGKSYEEAKELKNCKVFLSKEECMEAVKKISRGALLIKASRSCRFEDIADIVREAGKKNAV